MCADPCVRCGCLRSLLCGPVALVGGLVRCGVCGFCDGGGCGDVYWGDWISEPPDYCDSCDGVGHWTGSGCSHCGAATDAEVIVDPGYLSGSSGEQIERIPAELTAGGLKPVPRYRRGRPAQNVARRYNNRGQCTHTR
ncbi:MAG TPA: hypothetical protein EYH34_18170 [Planctomycetes bacterium]|nr:hypothetical protein [Planctomycetota bacterium]